MKKLRDQVEQQLELRLLADLNARGDLAPSAKVGAAGSLSEPSAYKQAAGDGDLTVYRQISDNYFSSLRK